jgi:hypothetical protein
VIVSALSLATCLFIEARLENCAVSIKAGRFSDALPLASGSLSKPEFSRQLFSTIEFSPSEHCVEVRCLTTCSPGARYASAEDNQTRSARSGATIVRHHCLVKAFWRWHSRPLIFWRPVFATIFLRRCAFQIFASRFASNYTPDLGAKFCNRERDSSYLHPPPTSVIGSAHSLATCLFIEARSENWAVSIKAGRFSDALPLASGSLSKPGFSRQLFSTIVFSPSEHSVEVRCLTTCSPGARRPSVTITEPASRAPVQQLLGAC